MADILKNIKEKLPGLVKEAKFEGANIVLYTENENFFKDDQGKVREIVGEISDEFDVLDDDIDFEKINENTYLFAAKTSIIDFCKVLKISDDIFYEIEGDFDSIAGLFLELYGNIPKKGIHVTHHNFKFTVESLDNRRIKKMKVEIDDATQ